MTEEQLENLKWYDHHIIGQYSTIDFARTGIALIFITMCVTFITLYIHKSVDETTQNKLAIHTEFVNMTRNSVYDPANNLVLKAPELVIDRILEFPVSYDKLDMQGYIILDTVTGVRYIYLRNAFGITFTKYWTGKELEFLGGDPNHTYQDLYKDRPLRDDLHK